MIAWIFAVGFETVNLIILGILGAGLIAIAYYLAWIEHNLL